MSVHFTRLTLLGLLLATLSVHAHMARPSGCDAALNAQETLITAAADLESKINRLEIASSGRDRGAVQALRGELLIYIDRLLDPADATATLQGDLDSLRQRYLFLRQASATAAAPGPKTLMDFVGQPEGLTAENEIAVGNPDSTIQSVWFSEDALAGLREQNELNQTRFLRAIYTGLVGPIGQSGVKRLLNVHRELAEVKIRTRGHDRLIGCLNQGRLILWRLIPDGGLGRFKTLCR